MKIIIAEDDDPKLARIRDVILGMFPDAEIASFAAANTTLSALREATPDLLILDMSLPTFVIGRGEPGGRPQDFGGLEVMDHMEVEEISCPTIVVTQHEEFPTSEGASMSREQVAETAATNHPDTFAGIVYYRSVANDWEGELRDLIDSFVSQGKP